MKKCNEIGYINKIDTYSTLDGGGIRSVVFLQGCNLRCVCCHNPETWEGGNVQRLTAIELYDKLKTYKSYYGVDGGITFSGGEPLLQKDFLLAAVEVFKKNDINSIVETSANIEIDDTIIQIVKNLDYVICDLKYPDNDMYCRYTLGSLDRTLAFLDLCKGLKKKVWIRTVVIPDINDNEKILARYQKIIRKYPNIFKWELLPFSKLGFGKYEELKIKNPLKGIVDIDNEKFEKLQEKFEFEKAK
ncbi:MAG: radical SAM protein [Clostridia bacterium]|nr:radical SAM protein [Clostridia bacterium]